MSHKFSIEATAELPLLKDLQARCAAFAADNGWGEEPRFQIELALEEVLMNVITHGRAGAGRVPRVRVSLQQQGAVAVLEIDDDGMPFDPRQAPAPDLEAGLEERRVGGLGVFLVQQFMDSVTYRREGGWNRLELRKRTA